MVRLLMQVLLVRLELRIKLVFQFLALYSDSRQYGAENAEKLVALQEVAESQFPYANLYTVGLIKLRGEVFSSTQELLEALPAYIMA